MHRTQNTEEGLPVPVIITVYADKSFSFETKTTPASYLLKKAAGIETGSGTPNTDKVGIVTRAQLEEIARSKEPDLTAVDLDAAVRTIAGTARSMGYRDGGVITCRDYPNARREAREKIDAGKHYPVLEDA